MEFKEKFEEILSRRRTTKPSVAKQMGMPESTFRFKSVELKRWNVVEFFRLAKLLQLTDLEINCLLSDLLD